MIAWLLSTLLFAPATSNDADVLDSLPSEFSVVLRVDGILSTANDLQSMLEAMSPNLAKQAGPQIDQGVDQFINEYSPEAAGSSFLFLMPLPEMESMQGGETPPFAIAVENASFEGVLESISGPESEEPNELPGGYVSVEGDSGPVYLFDGDNFVAFSAEESLIKTISQTDGPSLAETIGDRGTERLFKGNLGLFVDLNAVEAQYGDALEQGKQQFFQAMKMAGQQTGNAEMMDSAVAMYEKMFEAAEDAVSLTVSLDPGVEGLAVSADIAFKEDSEASEFLGSIGKGPSAGFDKSLTRMPADAAYYFSASMDAKAMASLQQYGLSMLFSQNAEMPAEVQEGLNKMAQVGDAQMVGSVAFSDGIQQVFIVKTENVDAYLDSMTNLYRGFDDEQGVYGEFIKNIEVEPAANRHEGIDFTRLAMTFNIEKMVPQTPEEANVSPREAVRAIYGGDSLTVWMGSDEGRVISLVAPNWESATALLDQFRNESAGLGQVASYQDVLNRLPEESTMTFLVNMQGVVQQFSEMFSGMFDRPIEPSSDMPEEPALIGSSVVLSAEGIELEMFVPSSVGAVIEQGFIPLFQNLQPNTQ